MNSALGPGFLWRESPTRSNPTFPDIRGNEASSGTVTATMEAFEQFVAVYLEQHDYGVSSAVKFPFS